MSGERQSNNSSVRADNLGASHSYDLLVQMAEIDIRLSVQATATGMVAPLCLPSVEQDKLSGPGAHNLSTSIQPD